MNVGDIMVIEVVRTEQGVAVRFAYDALEIPFICALSKATEHIAIMVDSAGISVRFNRDSVPILIT